MEYTLDTSLAHETAKRLDAMTRAYIEAAMWTLTDESGQSLDYLGLHDVAEATIATAERDCADFRAQAGDLLEGADLAQVGHDLWLTRNHHGAGFWDRSAGTYPADPDGQQLTALAHGMGSADWSLGDDGYVYQA